MQAAATAETKDDAEDDRYIQPAGDGAQDEPPRGSYPYLMDARAALGASRARGGDAKLADARDDPVFSPVKDAAAPRQEEKAMDGEDLGTGRNVKRGLLAEEPYAWVYGDRAGTSDIHPILPEGAGEEYPRPLGTPLPRRGSPPDLPPERPLPAHQELPLPGSRGISCLALGQDASVLVAGGDTSSLWCWRLPSGVGVEVRDAHAGPKGVAAVAISPLLRYVVSGGASDGRVRVWELMLGGANTHTLPHIRPFFTVRVLQRTSAGLRGLSPSPPRVTGVAVWDEQSGSLDPAPHRRRSSNSSVLTYEIRDEKRRPREPFVALGCDDGKVFTCTLRTDPPRLSLLADADHAAEMLDMVGARSMALTSCGRLLAVGFGRAQTAREEYLQREANRICVWRITAPGAPTPSSELLCVLHGHTRWVRSLAFMGPPRDIRETWEYLVSGSTDGTVRVWSLSSGSQIRRFQAGDDDDVTVLGVATTSTGALILGAVYDRVLIWDFLSGKTHRVVEASALGCGDDETLGALAVTGGLDVLVAGCKPAKHGDPAKARDAFISIARRVPETWSILRGRTKELPGPALHMDKADGKRRWNCVNALLPLSNTHVASASALGTICIWNISNAELEDQWDAVTREGDDGDFLDGLCATHRLGPAGQSYLVSVARAGTMSVWSWSPAAGHTRLQADTWAHEGYFAVDVSTDGRFLCTGGNEDGRLCFFEGREDPDGRYMFSPADSFEATGSAIEAAYISLCGNCKALAFSTDPDATFVATAGRDTLVWDRRSRELKFRLRGLGSFTRNALAFPCRRATATSDDPEETLQYQLLVSRESRVTLLDLDVSGTAARKRMDFAGRHRSWVNAVTMSPDCRYILTGSSDKMLQLWNVETGRSVRRMEKHKPVLSVAFGPDASYLVAGFAFHNGVGVGHAVILDDFHAIRAAQVLPSVEEITKQIGVDINDAAQDADHPWARFANADAAILAEICLTQAPLDVTFSHDKRRRSSDGSGSLSRTGPRRSLIQVAVAADAPPLLAILLRAVPHGFILSHDRPGEDTLLGEALTRGSPGCIRVILEAIWRVCTLQGMEVVRKAGYAGLAPWLGDAAPAHRQSALHASDYVLLEELCEVGRWYPDLFAAFVSSLRAVPQYTFVLGKERLGALADNAASVVASSCDRCPAALVPGADATLSSGAVSSKEPPGSFWEQQAGLVKFRGVTGLRQVSPFLLPLRNLAGREGSAFLATLVGICVMLDDVSPFDNEVIGHLVAFKWRKYNSLFISDFVRYSLMSVLFATNALLYNTFADDTNDLVRAIGILLWLLAAGFLCYFVHREILHVRSAWRRSASEKEARMEDVAAQSQPKAPTEWIETPTTRGALRGYATNWWNVLDIVNFLMIFFAFAAAVVTLMQRVPSSEERKLVHILCAATMPTIAAQFLFYLQGLDRTREVVRLTINITQRIRDFCLVLVVFILTFGVAFVLLFRPVQDDLDLEYDGYSQFHNALMTTFSFLLGNYDVADLEESASPQLAILLLVGFLFITSLVMLNLLIAIMGTLMKDVRQRAVAECCFARCALLLEYEGIYGPVQKLHAAEGDDEAAFLQGRSRHAEQEPAYVQVLTRGKTTSWDNTAEDGTEELLRSLLRSLDGVEQRAIEREREGRAELQREVEAQLSRFLRRAKGQRAL